MDRDRSTRRPDPASDGLYDLTDEELVSAHLDGSPRAFQELYGRYRRRLLGFLGRRTRDSDRAQDLLQETFVRVLRHMHRFKTDRNFSTWIFTIAANLAKNEYRDRRRSPLVLFQALDGSGEADKRSLQFADGKTRPDQLYRERQLLESVERAVTGLPPLQRDVFRLREMEGKSYREIGDIMGVSVGTVKSRVYRAREAFRHQIEPMLPG